MYIIAHREPRRLPACYMEQFTAHEHDSAMATSLYPQIYIYKYLDTGLVSPSVAIFDTVKLTSSALTHADACAPAKLVVYI